MGMEHSPTSSTGAGWERSPWYATQRAAWEALKKAADGFKEGFFVEEEHGLAAAAS